MLQDALERYRIEINRLKTFVERWLKALPEPKERTAETRRRMALALALSEILKDNSNLIGKCNELNNILDNLSFYKKFNSFDNYNFDESLLEFFDQKLKPLKFEEKKILNDLISKLKNLVCRFIVHLSFVKVC